MKNTLALSMVIIGGMLVYGGYKDYSFADTIRFFTGQALKDTKTPLGVVNPNDPLTKLLPGGQPSPGSPLKPAPNSGSSLPQPLNPSPKGASS